MPGKADPAEVRRCLRRILESAEFSSATRLQQFLTFVVEKALEGAETIKETEIALRVFHRPSTFDPSGDSVVRVSASNLRNRLRDYYLTAGSQDSVVIEIAKGSYLPSFRVCAPDAGEPARKPVRGWKMATAILASELALGAVAFWILEARSHRALSSIAVLPFLNLSQNNDDEYLVEGFVEELTTSLAEIDGLKVVARTSAYQFLGKSPDIRAAGRQLGVETILEGSLRTVGNQTRVSAQLIKVADGFHIWSHLWECESKDLPAIQRALAEAIATALRHPGEARTRPPRNLEAYDLYLKGEYFKNRTTSADLGKGIGYLQRSIEVDPTYAPAHWALGDAYASLAYHQAAPDRDLISKAKAAASEALRLDESLAEPHAVLAWIQFFFDWDWAASEREMRRALELNPNSANVHDRYSQRLLAEGRFREALAEGRKAVDLDPLNYRLATNVAVVLYCAHRYEEAIRQARLALELSPHYYQAHTMVGASLAEKKLYREAEGELRTAMSEYAGDADTIAHLAAVDFAQGKQDEALKWLAVLQNPSAKEPPAYYEQAFLFLVMGQKDRVFDALDQAYQQRSSDMIVLTVDPVFDSLHNDPRFLALRQKMGWSR